MIDAHTARQMWSRFEPIHAVTFYTPEARAAFDEVGLTGYWRGYFGGRVSPMGAVDATPVVSAFFGFARRLVAATLPDIWTRSTPEQALTARRRGGEAALVRMLAGQDASIFVEVADLAEAATDLLDPAGRPLGAANLALPKVDGAGPLSRLWQAATTIREHRGDGHVAALVAYGFDGIESVVWRSRPEQRADVQDYRGWTDEEWDAAVARLRARGWLDARGEHTKEGDGVYGAVEDATDRAAARVWDEFGLARTVRLRDLLTPLAVATYSGIPLVNPVNGARPAAA